MEYGTALVVAGERPAEQVAFESGVVGLFVEGAELFGVPRSVAAIYGIVFASPTPLSFAEIAERLDLSNGSISQGLKALRDIGAVRPVAASAPSRRSAAKGQEARGKGPDGQGPEASSYPLPLTPYPPRHTAWAPDTEMRKLIERFLETRVQRQLASGADRLADLKRRVAAFPADEQAALQGRVAKLEQWHSRTRALIPLIRTFLKLGG